MIIQLQFRCLCAFTCCGCLCYYVSAADSRILPPLRSDCGYALRCLCYVFARLRLPHYVPVPIRTHLCPCRSLRCYVTFALRLIAFELFTLRFTLLLRIGLRLRYTFGYVHCICLRSVDLRLHRTFLPVPVPLTICYSAFYVLFRCTRSRFLPTRYLYAFVAFVRCSCRSTTRFTARLRLRCSVYPDCYHVTAFAALPRSHTRFAGYYAHCHPAHHAAHGSRISVALRSSAYRGYLCRALLPPARFGSLPR